MRRIYFWEGPCVECTPHFVNWGTHKADISIFSHAAGTRGGLLRRIAFNLNIKNPSILPSEELDQRSDDMYVALIRTHHITSRKKVATLKATAKKLGCYALLRSGGVPGVMYVEGDGKDTVQRWVDVVHDLRYKDYQLAAPVTDVKTAVDHARSLGDHGLLEEVATVKEMGAKMDDAGLRKWWRKAMGFSQE